MPSLPHLLASLFGIGYIKPLSATWGSLASGIALYFFWPDLTLSTKLTITLLTFLLGWYLSNIITTPYTLHPTPSSLHDPHFIVLDETVGMMITTLFLSQTFTHWFLAFVLFRIFDILKLWPASWFDKRKGGFAIMFDDVLMALPSLILTQLIIIAGSNL